jgi:transposase
MKQLAPVYKQMTTDQLVQTSERMRAKLSQIHSTLALIKREVKHRDKDPNRTPTSRSHESTEPDTDLAGSVIALLQDLDTEEVKQLLTTLYLSYSHHEQVTGKHSSNSCA